MRIRSRRRRRVVTIGIILLLAVVLVNVLAYRHAWAMTHFVADGQQTPGPDRLTTLGKAKALAWGVRVVRPCNDSDPKNVGLPFATLRIDGAGGALEAWHVAPERPRGVVLLFHGYLAYKACLLAEARALYDLGFAALLVDFRGHGGSDGTTTTLGAREAEDVARAFAYAREKWPGLPVVLYGSSMGASAVLRAVARHDVAPAAVVVTAPFDRLLSAVRNRFRMMGVPHWPFAELLVFWGGAQHGFNGFRHNPADDARSVTCPALVLHGGRDDRAPPAMGAALVANFAGPKHFEVFPEAGHESLILADGERWKRAVAEFLNGALE